MDSKYKGAWVKSSDIENPANPHKVVKKDLYTPEQKKKIKPTEDCYLMYVDSNETVKNITNYLKRNFKRKIKGVDCDGSCLFNGILHQASRYEHRYSAP